MFFPAGGEYMYGQNWGDSYAETFMWQLRGDTANCT